MAFTTNQAISSVGVIWTVGTTAGASPGATEEIHDVISFSGFDGAAAEVSVTHMNSAAAEFRLGHKDYGTVTLNLNGNITDAGQAILNANHGGEAFEFKVQLPPRAGETTGQSMTFLALIRSFSWSGGVDDSIKATVSLRLSGDVTFVAAA